MDPSVEITDRSEELLDELRTEIHRETGREVSRQELLERMVADAWEARDGLIDSFRDERPTGDEIERWFSEATDEVETSEDVADDR